MPRLWVQQLTFSDGSNVTLEKNDIILVVGSNNAGKSATLRAIRDKLVNDSGSPVVSAILFGREGDAEEVANWLNTFAWKADSFAANPVFQAFGTAVHKNQIQPWWANPNYAGPLGRFFCHLLTQLS